MSNIRNNNLDLKEKPHQKVTSFVRRIYRTKLNFKTKRQDTTHFNKAILMQKVTFHFSYIHFILPHAIQFF